MRSRSHRLKLFASPIAALAAIGILATVSAPAQSTTAPGLAENALKTSDSHIVQRPDRVRMAANSSTKKKKKKKKKKRTGSFKF